MMIHTPHITEAGESPAIYNMNILDSFNTKKQENKVAKDEKHAAEFQPTMREKAEAILGRDLPE